MDIKEIRRRLGQIGGELFQLADQIARLDRHLAEQEGIQLGKKLSKTTAIRNLTGTPIEWQQLALMGQKKAAIKAYIREKWGESDTDCQKLLWEEAEKTVDAHMETLLLILVRNLLAPEHG